MLPTLRQLLGLWFIGWDLGLIALSAWLVCEPPLRYPALLALAGLCLILRQLHQVHRLRRGREELERLLQAMLLWLLLLLVLEPVPGLDRYSLLQMVGLATVLVFLARRCWWYIIGSLRAQGYNPTPVVIVGTGRVARRTARGITHAGWTGMHVLGFIEDESTRWTSDLHILGKVSDLPRLVLEHGISQVFIALPIARYAEVRRIYEVLSQSIVEVRLILDAAPLTPLSLSTTKLDGLTVVGLRDNPHLGLNQAVKRGMDLAFASVGLVLLSPVFLLIALLVKLTSRGPVFYLQERCGLNGLRFQMVKFRTMTTQAEAQTGPVWATRLDNRTTVVGSWLRRTSLAELPQLFNVLR